MRLGVGSALVGSTIVPGDVEIIDGRIVRIGLASRGRGLAAPGFVDLQVNGFAGVDFLGADASGYERAGDALLETGVTSYLPTFITAPEEELIDGLRAIPVEAVGPRILGAHLEGPFLAAGRLGAHRAAARRDPDRGLARRLLDAGPVRLMTLAPELPGALELVDDLIAHGCAVSCGHSDATAAEAHAAFDRGVAAVTHLFNSMRPLTHRDPGIVGAALIRPDVTVQVIVDGVHLADDVVRLVLAAAPGRVALVTDAISGAGVGDGTFLLGGVTVEIADGVARRADGVLAGSALTMIDAVRHLHRLDIPLETALAAASSLPARILGILGVGSIDVGAPADLVVLDDTLEIERVLVAGRTRVAA